MRDKKLLLATANPGKVRELKELLAAEGGGQEIALLSLADFPDAPEVEETGQTFQENAFLKARALCAYTKLVTLADDSGLEVDALGGAPGIFSARYAGEPKSDQRNNEKLLDEMTEIPTAERTARFRCALALVTPQGEEYEAQGKVEGLILRELRGAGGFGYDPLFLVPERKQTMAELPLEEKNSFSHRARAFQEALPLIRRIFED